MAREYVSGNDLLRMMRKMAKRLGVNRALTPEQLSFQLCLETAERFKKAVGRRIWSL
jgi:hypothetical protein